MDDIDLDVNLEDIPDSEDYIKPGRYLIKVEELKRDFSTDGSKEFIKATFRTVDTQISENVSCIDRPIFEIFNLNEKSLWKLKGFLNAVYPGLTGNKIPGDIEGKVFSAHVYIDKYGGGESFRCKRFINADDWEGINFIVSDGNLVPQEGAGSNGASQQASSSEGKALPAGGGGSSDEVEL